MTAGAAFPGATPFPALIGAALVLLGVRLALSKAAADRLDVTSEPHLVA